MTGPYESYLWVVQVVTAIFAGLTALLQAWSAHRRRMADCERRSFEETVRAKLGLPYDKTKILPPNGERRYEP